MNRHSNDLRIRVINHIKLDNTVAATSRLFKVAISTIRKWVIEDKLGNLTKVNHYRNKTSKIDYDQFVKLIEANPDLYYREIADHFHCSISLAHKLCTKLDITVKKNRQATEKLTKG